MRCFVITMADNQHSVNYSKRCIESGAKYGVQVFAHAAFTPANNPAKIAEVHGIRTDTFRERFSRFENALAAFLSHYTLWRAAVDMNDEVLILEHDAVFRGPIPNLSNYDGCISFGAPSYGKFNTPATIGVNKLTSKPYFPGAHAYLVRADRAKQLIDRASVDACPTDVYLHIQRFPFLQEYYPWPVEAHDNFTTIQNEIGCRAKHRYGPGYQIL